MIGLVKAPDVDLDLMRALQTLNQVAAAAGAKMALCAFGRGPVLRTAGDVHGRIGIYCKMLERAAGFFAAYQTVA